MYAMILSVANIMWPLPVALLVGFGMVKYAFPFLKTTWHNYFNKKNLPLFQACNNNDLPAIQKALENGANVNARDDKGNTPLLIVLLKYINRFYLPTDETKIIDFLLAKGADLRIRNKDGINAQELQKNKDLLNACRLQDFEKVEKALTEGANINAQDEDGNTPLLILLPKPNTAKLVNFLLKKGADVLIHNKHGLNAQDLQKNGPLFKACHEYDSVAIQKALEDGININAQDENGNTPLLIILSKPNSANFAGSITKTVTSFITKGADPLICNRQGHDALSIAIKQGLHEVIGLFKRENSFNQFNNKGETPLMHAVGTYCENHREPTTREIKTIETLLELGADPNIKSQAKRHAFTTTPFILALYELHQPRYKKDRMHGNLHLAGLHHQAELDNPTLAEKEKSLALCNLLLDKGSLPCATIESMYGSPRNYFFEISSDDRFKSLIDRCKTIIENRDIYFNILEEVAQSHDLALIEKTVKEAIQYQATADPQAIEKLTIVFIRENNTTGLSYLDNHLKPNMAGFASLHHQMALANLASVDHHFHEALGSQSEGKTKDISLLDGKPEAQEQVMEYQTLAVKHLIMGGMSQETSDDAKKIAKELNRLFQMTLTGWKGEVASPDKDFEETCFDIISQHLVEGTKDHTQLFRLKKAQASTALLAPSPPQVNANVSLGGQNR